jgi:hypothetical protein
MERPLIRGPHFAADPIDTEREDRYGFVKEENYEVVDQNSLTSIRTSTNIIFGLITVMVIDLHYTSVGWMIRK